MAWGGGGGEHMIVEHMIVERCFLNYIHKGIPANFF